MGSSGPYLEHFIEMDAARMQEPHGDETADKSTHEAENVVLISSGAVLKNKGGTSFLEDFNVATGHERILRKV